MRVVNERKWRRAKWILVGLLTLLLMWAIGGLEDGDYNSPTLALVLLPALGLLIHNLTKHWIEDEKKEGDWYDRF